VPPIYDKVTNGRRIIAGKQPSYSPLSAYTSEKAHAGEEFFDVFRKECPEPAGQFNNLIEV
jgi:hypothetical protein